MAISNTNFPFDYRLGAQHLANKWATGWWDKNASTLTDPTALTQQLQRQLYAALPNLDATKYRDWLNDYTWLTQNQGKMPAGFVAPAVPDTTTPTVPPGGPNMQLPTDLGKLFPGWETGPDAWANLTPEQTQKALAYYSAALPYAELAASERRAQTDQAWKQRVDSWGVSGRAQLPSGGFVRRY